MDWQEFKGTWKAGEEVKGEWEETRRQAEGEDRWKNLAGWRQEDSSDEEEWEVERVVKARQGLRGVEYRVEWKDWKGWDTWEPQQQLGKGLKRELEEARECNWEHTSWREWLQARYSDMEVERRVLWKGSRAEEEVGQMVKDFWEVMEERGGGEERARVRRRLDARERGLEVRRGEGVRRLYLQSGLQGAGAMDIVQTGRGQGQHLQTRMAAPMH